MVQSLEMRLIWLLGFNSGWTNIQGMSNETQTNEKESSIQG